jgi:hypothetical protein
MGLEQAVNFPGEVPSWPAVRELLERHAQKFETRMIDGELAFPDEEPPPAWHELRLATGGRMITLRRDANRITFVVWGNADPGLLRARNALMWGFARAGNGTIVTEAGVCAPAEFVRSADLPNEIRQPQP